MARTPHSGAAPKPPAPGPGARRGNGTAPRPERTARTSARPAAPGLPESHMRSQLLRLAVLPPVAVA
ncbi:hypothetical protein [Streptomyces thermocarboxydus]|uniref:hypothetical protein n=1 Tax=Streptomyces thermocarboxydus TaxID=59299 RepID=UPI003B5061A7